MLSVISKKAFIIQNKMNWTWPNGRIQFILFNLLLQRIELRSGEKFCEGNIQAIADLFYRQNLRINASAVQDVLHRRRRQSAHRGELVDGDIPFCAQAKNSVLNSSNGIHSCTVPSFASI